MKIPYYHNISAAELQRLGGLIEHMESAYNVTRVANIFMTTIEEKNCRMCKKALMEMSGEFLARLIEFCKWRKIWNKQL